MWRSSAGGSRPGRLADSAAVVPASQQEVDPRRSLALELDRLVRLHFERIAERCRYGFRDLDRVRRRGGLQAARDVDCVAPQVVDELAGCRSPRQRRVRHAGRSEPATAPRPRAPPPAWRAPGRRAAPNVIARRSGESGGGHVGIADRLDLLHAERRTRRVKRRRRVVFSDETSSATGRRDEISVKPTKSLKTTATSSYRSAISCSPALSRSMISCGRTLSRRLSDRARSVSRSLIDSVEQPRIRVRGSARRSVEGRLEPADPPRHPRVLLVGGSSVSLMCRAGGSRTSR